MLVNLPLAVCQVIQHLTRRGFSAYLVGGSVRALLQGTTPHDYDLTTDARPDQILAVFSAYRVSTAGSRHGTIRVMLDHMPIEITTLRIDGTYSDRRRPDQVVFTHDIKADLARRDFTINAMAWIVPPECLANESGQGATVAVDFSPEQLIDPYNGQADLATGLIRCVGQADLRLTEDALRILRALRLAATLGFSIEDATAAAMRRYAASLRIIASERILPELARTLNGGSVAPVLTAYWDILTVILPEIEPLQRRPQDLVQIANKIQHLPADFPLRLAVLITAAPDANRLSDPLERAMMPGRSQVRPDVLLALERLRCDQATQHRIAALINSLHARPAAQLVPVKHWLRRFGAATIRDALTLLMVDEATRATAGHLEQLASRILTEGHCYRVQDLAINGSDLLQLGLPTGRRIGQVLDHLLDQVIAGQIENDKQALLQAAAAEIEVNDDRT